MKTHAIIFSQKNGFIKALSKDWGLIFFKENKKFSSQLRLFSEVDLVLDSKKNAKDVFDLIEADASFYYENIEKNLSKYFISSLWIKILLSSYCEPEIYPLFKNAMTVLNDSKEDDSFLDFINFQFLWRLLYIFGIKPETKRSFLKDPVLNIYFSFKEMNFIFHSELLEFPEYILISKNIFIYLLKTQSLALSESLDYNNLLSEKDLTTLISIAYYVIESNLGFKIDIIDKKYRFD